MINEVVAGTGMSPWEAQVVVEVVREVYFATPGAAPLRHGQPLYTCVSHQAGAGVALKDCPMTSVTLNLMTAVTIRSLMPTSCAGIASVACARRRASRAGCSRRRISRSFAAAMRARFDATSQNSRSSASMCRHAVSRRILAPL